MSGYISLRTSCADSIQWNARVVVRVPTCIDVFVSAVNSPLTSRYGFRTVVNYGKREEKLNKRVIIVFKRNEKRSVVIFSLSSFHSAAVSTCARRDRRPSNHADLRPSFFTSYPRPYLPRTGSVFPWTLSLLFCARPYWKQRNDAHAPGARACRFRTPTARTRNAT